MGRGMRKAERLEEIKRLYVQRAYSDIELAGRLGVARETIYRDRIELTAEYPIEQDSEGRYRIDKSRLISEIKVNLHEALSLYLAARKASRQTRIHHPHAASAVEKLAAALRQPMTERLLRAADGLLKQEKAPERIEIQEKVAQAWVEGRKLRIRYQGLHSRGFTNHVIHPYLIEPSIWSDSLYVVAYSETFEKVIPFRIDRIENAVVSGETFEIPPGFDEAELLKHAWGIWYGEGEAQTVKLRFSRAVARRVKESIWHPLETVSDLEDGGCSWEAPIAEPQEMLPWIRGWGAEVEVLEPEGLRKALEREVRRMAEVYEVMEKKTELYAHFRQKDKEHKEPQYLMDHLTAASELAGKFAGKFGLKETGKILGLLHDLGKASKEFQDYLLSGEGLKDPDADDYVDHQAKKGKIDHSTAGAQLIYEKLWNEGQKEQIAAQVLSLCLASHHSGLIDCLKPDGENNYKRRMEKSDEDTHKTEALSHLPEIKTHVDNFILNGGVEQIAGKLKSLQKEGYSKNTLFFRYGLLIRLLLSCLLDADRLDTADFENPGNVRIRNHGKYCPWSVLVDRLEEKYAEFARQTEEMVPGKACEVNQLRSQVAQACLEYAEKAKGIYQLTVPTGGGKTLASLRFALHHAQVHMLDRVFYIIPYTSIIDQNAEEVRKILEDKDNNGKLLDEVVLEHHSNLTPEEETRRNSLLTENWDAPVVFTTQVQFLEVLFGSGTRNARRMHQLANAVIILDEVQTIPVNTIHMLNEALRFLADGCGSSIVLCTATQPPLDKLENPYRKLTINPEQRIIQNEKELFEKLKRVDVFDERKPGGWQDDEVTDLIERQLAEKGSVLIVVNTKKSARNLYQQIKSKNMSDTYHLSTSMCPTHRLDVLTVVKEKLKKNEPVICVSTQLIEAGVDIDFGSVIRYLAGLDSIAQSAGRCNRHGARPGFGNVWIVNPENENIEKLKDITLGSDKAQTFLDNFRENPKAFDSDRIGLEAMAAYYRSYYSQREEDMCYKVGPDSLVGRNDDLFNLLSINQLSVSEFTRINDNTLPPLAFMQSFQTAAKTFRVIDSPTQGVVVPYGNEGKNLITELCRAYELEKQYKLLKAAQRYSVNLFPNQFRKMAEEMRAINRIQEGVEVYYLDQQYYSDEFGWSDKPVSSMETLIK